MTVETATKVEDLNSSYPAFGDLKSEGDDHIRLIKSCLRYTFAGAASTGVTGFNVVTQAPSTNNTLAASTNYVDAAVTAAAFTTALPVGSNGQILYTTAGLATWTTVKTFSGQTLSTAGDIAVILPRTEVSGTTQTAAANVDYWLENVATTAVTANASPVDGERFAVTPANGLLSNTIDFGSATVRGPAGTVTGVLTLNLGARMEFKYSTTLTKWVVV